MTTRIRILDGAPDKRPLIKGSNTQSFARRKMATTVVTSSRRLRETGLVRVR